MSETAWQLIGFPRTEEENHLWVRLVGGRALYEAVEFCDGGRQERVRLCRLDVTAGGLHQVNRMVDPDALVEIVDTAGNIVTTTLDL